MKAEIKTSTGYLKTEARSMMNFLRNEFDKNMQIFIGTPFFLAYDASRKIYNYSSASNTVRGNVTNAANDRLKGAEVQLIVDRDSYTRKTNNQGNFSFSKFGSTVHTIHVIAKAKGYAPREYIVNLRVGYTNNIQITLFDEQKQMEQQSALDGLKTIITEING